MAKDAASAVTRLRLGKMVTGREKCEAADGAPDCRAAAIKLCRIKGFEGGQSADIQSFQKCPTEMWLSGRAPSRADCTGESYVTRALCQ